MTTTETPTDMQHHPVCDGPPGSGKLTVVNVPLEGRAYDILIGRGAMALAGDRIAQLAPGGTVGVVSDTNVAPLHADALRQSLQAAGLRTSLTVVAPGESTKSWPMFAQVCDALIGHKIERKDIVLALGGGVVGDLTGFAAASIRRGVGFVQVPTTLLAQVDSSVGGKTGINSPHGKNLVGAFYQPQLVICDTALLDTLPLREMRAGYAEVVKYGLIDQPGFFDWCEANWSHVYAGGPERDHAVAVSCRAKAAVVLRDEHEHGDRALLNLGHTFAHALERLTGYDGARLVHGEAVAIGMALAFRFSQRLGLCPGQDAVRVARHLDAAGLPTTLAQVPGGCGTADQLVEAMSQDKKVVRGALTFILARSIGQSFIARGIAANDVRAFLEAELA
jgi:3-dehydroquinate synthase